MLSIKKFERWIKGIRQGNESDHKVVSTCMEKDKRQGSFKKSLWHHVELVVFVLFSQAQVQMFHMALTLFHIPHREETSSMVGNPLM